MFHAVSQDWFAFTSNGSDFNFTRAGEVVFPNSASPTAEDNYGFCQVIFFLFCQYQNLPCLSSAFKSDPQYRIDQKMD